MGTDGWLDPLITLTRGCASPALILTRKMPSSQLLVSFLAAYGLKEDQAKTWPGLIKLTIVKDEFMGTVGQ